MNRIQRTIFAVSIVTVLLMILFPPYLIPRPWGFSTDLPPDLRLHYTCIFSEDHRLIHYPLLIWQVLVVMALTGIAMALLQRRDTRNGK